MTKRKKIAIAWTGLAAFYLYMWMDGGTTEHYLVLCCGGTMAIFLLLQWFASLSK